MRIAVIGTGIAGNAAAWALSQRYPVTVYDRELRPGGHSHTVTIDYDGTRMAVDIGFIVYNELNYPELTKLFAHLGVETQASEMDFALTARDRRFEWKGGGHSWLDTAKGLFAQPRNLLSPSYLWMLRDILVFNTRSVEDYASGALKGLSLGEYFKMRKFAPRLLTDYLAPMGAAICYRHPIFGCCATSLPSTRAALPIAMPVCSRPCRSATISSFANLRRVC